MTRRAKRSKPDNDLLTTASAWFARMRSDQRTAEDEQRFSAWIEASPEHRNAYMGLHRSFGVFEPFAGHPRIMALQAADRRRSLRLLPRAPVMVRAGITALAASVMLVIALSGVVHDLPWAARDTANVHETASGSRSSFSLDDGTLVTLTSRSRIRPVYCEYRRLVVLDRGEAYFDVMHDAGRPFLVQAGDGEITAVGTEFDVHREGDEVTVTVTEGQVEVAAFDGSRENRTAVIINAGEQVSYANGRLSAVRTVDAGRVTAWTSGRLTVKDEPFILLVDEINRHSKYKLLLNRYDPRLQDEKISGIFQLDSPESLVEHLKSSGFPVYGVKNSRGNVKLKFRPRGARG